MDRRVLIGGGIVAVAAAAFGLRMATNSGARQGLDEALAHLPPGFTATHGPVSANAVTGEAQVRDLVLMWHGARVFSAGSLSASGVGAADATGTPERIGEVVLHDASFGPYRDIQRVNLTGVALATLRQVIDPGAYPGGKPAWTDKRPVVEHAELHGIAGAQTVTNQNKTVSTQFSVALATLDAIRLSQLPSAPDYAAEAAVTSAALSRSLAFNAATTKDVSFTAKTDKGTVTGHLARASEGRADGGHVGEFDADDFTLTTDQPSGHVSIAGFSGHGLDASRMLALMPAMIATPNVPHPELMGSFHLEHAEMHGMTVDYPAAPLITMDSMSGGSADAATSVFDMRGLTIKTTGRPLPAAQRTTLQSFGMEDFTVDLDEAAGYDPDKQTLVLKRCDLALHGLGTLHFTMTLSGLPQDATSSKEAIAQAAANTKLNAASLTWDDASLTDRIIKVAAARQGVPPEQVVAALAMPLATLPILMPEQPDAGTQIQAFLNGKHRLSVQMAPAAPVGLAQWKETPAQARAALLGVRVEGN